MHGNTTTTGSITGISLGRALRVAWQWCRACTARRRQRFFLAQLDERGLRDIGITRGDVLREIEKPFWRE